MLSSIFKKTVIFLISIYVIILAVIFLYQRKLVFAPSKQLPTSDISGINEVILKTEKNETLYNWHSTQSESNKVILFMHGNSGNINTRIEKMKKLNALGYDVFLLGYPGYGKSQGSPSEKNFVASAKLAFEHLLSVGYSNDMIVLYGESMGTAVAIQLATIIDANSLILEAPLASVQEMAADRYPFLPIKWLLRDPFLSINHIEKVDEALLIIHGDMDTAVPISDGQRLFDRATSEKHFHIVKGGGHSDLYDFHLDEVITSFLAMRN